jgi:uncharacterized membrane protein
MNTRFRPVITAGIFLGLGMGGFFDGIVLHQILQWHHMVSAAVPVTTLDALELNVVLDGLFHTATYVFTTIGIVLLFRALKSGIRDVPGRVLIGGQLIGWGVFNLVEGIVNHHILQLHHVRHGDNELLWDLGFLAWGGLMLVIGWLLIRAAAQQPQQTYGERDPQPQP